MSDVTEQIWIEYQRKLRAFIRARVSDDSTVDDILQDIFVTIHTRIDTLKDETKFESWLYQITRNAIIDYYRSHKISEPLPEELIQPDIDNDTSAKRELESCLEPMIGHLPDKYRDSVYLSEITGISQKEVAEKLGISHSGAKSRIQRGRLILKGMLHECCNIEINKKNQVVDVAKKSNNKDCC